MRTYKSDAAYFLFVCDSKRMFLKSGVMSDTKTIAANYLDLKTFQTRIIISAQQNFRLKLLMMFLKWFKEWLEFETCKKRLATKQKHSFKYIVTANETQITYYKKFFKKKSPGKYFEKQF